VQISVYLSDEKFNFFITASFYRLMPRFSPDRQTGQSLFTAA
jgi:hypothetical protein